MKSKISLSTRKYWYRKGYRAYGKYYEDGLKEGLLRGMKVGYDFAMEKMKKEIINKI